MASTIAEQAKTVSEGSASGVSEFLTKIWDTFPYVIVAIIVMVTALFVGKVAKTMSQRALLKAGGHEGASNIIGKSAYAFCLVLGLTIALKILGIDISFITGAVVFGLGFGMKDIIENYIAGVMILLQQPFKIGDIIKVGSHSGRVEEIEARTTFIRVFDGQRVVVPNSDLLSQTVVNYSTYPERRIHVFTGISYDSDLNLAIKVLMEYLETVTGILKKPKPVVLVTEQGWSEIEIEIRFWVDTTLTNFLKKRSEVTQGILDVFNKAGIAMPYPVTTLAVDEHDSGELYNFLHGKQEK